MENWSFIRYQNGQEKSIIGSFSIVPTVFENDLNKKYGIVISELKMDKISILMEI